MTHRGLINYLCAAIPALLLNISGIALAQQPTKIFIGETTDMHSEILNEDRTLYIYTPTGYSYSEDRYPVIYMLDGAENFVHVSGIIHYLSGIGRAPQMIMVAIPNTQRTRDLSPSPVDGFPGSGGAANFLRFMDEELIPYIEGNYRTHPYRILAGHSLAGTFAIYTLLNKPDLFGAYIASSPSLGWDDGYLADQARSFFNKHARLDKFLYFTLGDEGDRKFEYFKEFVNTIKRTKPESFNWEFMYMPSESHGSIPHRSLYDGLEKLFADWAVPDEVAAAGLEPVLNHYRKLTDKFGYNISPPELYMNSLGYEFMNKRDLREALAIFAYNINLYPNSANVYDSYGEALEKDGQAAKAVENYLAAYNKGKEISDPNVNIYRQNYERVKASLDSD
jgi:predicted alpha/beta superfamily hydrolase